MNDLETIKQLSTQGYSGEYKDLFSKKFNEKGEEIKEDDDADDNLMKDFKSKLDLIENQTTQLNVVSFEKDDDTNHHIDWIHFTSLMRCNNYGIKTCDRFRTKMIAGKIIPALATTTAMITGFAMIEAFKVISKKPFESYRNTFSNLALNMHLLSEPMPKLLLKPTEMDIRFGCPSHPVLEKSSKWDQIQIQGPKTFAELNEFFRKEYGFGDTEYTIITTMDMFTGDSLDGMEQNMTMYKWCKDKHPELMKDKK